MDARLLGHPLDGYSYSGCDCNNCESIRKCNAKTEALGLIEAANERLEALLDAERAGDRAPEILEFAPHR